MVKYIFVTGGVLSSVGKGIVTSSIGKMLQTRGLKLSVVKIDPYVNVDAGTMNPYMHGEVFVTDDGGETDLDLGWYERFLDLSLKQENNVCRSKLAMVRALVRSGYGHMRTTMSWMRGNGTILPARSTAPMSGRLSTHRWLSTPS